MSGLEKSDIEKVQETVISYSGIIENSVVEMWLSDDHYAARNPVPGMTDNEAMLREVIKSTRGKKVAEPCVVCGEYGEHICRLYYLLHPKGEE